MANLRSGFRYRIRNWHQYNSMDATLPVSLVREQSAYLRQVSTALRQDRQKLRRFLSEQKQALIRTTFVSYSSWPSYVTDLLWRRSFCPTAAPALRVPVQIKQIGKILRYKELSQCLCVRGSEIHNTAKFILTCLGVVKK